MKKVIFIDWNRTLSFDLFWGHLQDSSHPNHRHFEPIEEWLFVENRDLINPWMRGQLVLEDIVDRMSQDSGIPADIIIDELRHSCEVMQFCVAGLEDFVRDIRARGIRVFVATDNMDAFTRFTVPALKIEEVFDGYLNSHDIGHLKGDSEPADGIAFFDTFLDENNLTYEDVVLLDDSPDESGKYQRLGFDMVLIDSPDTLRKTLESYAYEPCGHRSRTESNPSLPGLKLS